jgi:hypothetical protein
LRPRSPEPGEPLRFEVGAALDPRDVRLADERDTLLTIAAASPRNPQLLITAVEPTPGSYRWIAQGGVLDRAVVNFPEAESDLRRLTGEELQAGAGAVIQNAGKTRLGALREGRPLWPWFLAAAALLLLLEAFLARLFSPLPETTAAQPAGA